MISKSHPGLIRNLTDKQLLEEWSYWNEQIKSATSWGASLDVAVEFKTYCEQQLHLRKLDIPS